MSKYKVFSIAVTSKQYELLNKAVKKEGLPSRSEFIRRLIDFYALDLVRLYDKFDICMDKMEAIER